MVFVPGLVNAVARITRGEASGTLAYPNRLPPAPVVFTEYWIFPVLFASAKNCQIEFAVAVFDSDIEPDTFLAVYGSPLAVNGVLPPVVELVDEEMTVVSVREHTRSTTENDANWPIVPLIGTTATSADAV